jgi:hypothetical protein
MITIESAEKIRTARGLTAEQFSIHLGYSATAYLKALRRKRLSRWMAREISQRFRVKLTDT